MRKLLIIGLLFIVGCTRSMNHRIVVSKTYVPAGVEYNVIFKRPMPTPER